MKLWNVDIASEKKQRELMKANLAELEVEAESVPFAFNVKRSHHELRPAAVAYVIDVKSLIFHLLEEKQK